ncbi:hypothetical protein PAPYR_5122 [Paratrimastix pyriformis]|uniref:Protein kinase domain-containing protein n=1 Tax=Paratrimastix pyriformis TaxID=342808 RepID=A0ABQ8UKW0_9EUKA|nr:hypothetical protein PAPYR_5122 [Paratrimastix pyriformis]
MPMSMAWLAEGEGTPEQTPPPTAPRPTTPPQPQPSGPAQAAPAPPQDAPVSGPDAQQQQQQTAPTPAPDDARQQQQAAPTPTPIPSPTPTHIPAPAPEDAAPEEQEQAGAVGPVPSEAEALHQGASWAWASPRAPSPGPQGAAQAEGPQPQGPPHQDDRAPRPDGASEAPPSPPEAAPSEEAATPPPAGLPTPTREEAAAEADDDAEIPTRPRVAPQQAPLPGGARGPTRGRSLSQVQPSPRPAPSPRIPWELLDGPPPPPPPLTALATPEAPARTLATTPPPPPESDVALGPRWLEGLAPSPASPTARPRPPSERRPGPRRPAPAGRPPTGARLPHPSRGAPERAVPQAPGSPSPPGSPAQTGPAAAGLAHLSPADLGPPPLPASVRPPLLGQGPLGQCFLAALQGRPVVVKVFSGRLGYSSFLSSQLQRDVAPLAQPALATACRQACPLAPRPDCRSPPTHVLTLHTVSDTSSPSPSTPSVALPVRMTGSRGAGGEGLAGPLRADGVCLVSPYCGGGNLRAFLSKGAIRPGQARLARHAPLARVRPAPWKERLRVALEVARILAALHSAPLRMRTRPRCLKPENVLFDEGGGVWLADWGLPQLRRIAEGLAAAEGGGWPDCSVYRAPEMENMLTHTESSDIFVLGLILWEMATLHPWQWPQWADPPRLGQCFAKMGGAEGLLRANPLPQDVPHGWGDLVLKCWAWPPEERPTADQVVDLLREFE